MCGGGRGGDFKVPVNLRVTFGRNRQREGGTERERERVRVCVRERERERVRARVRACVCVCFDHTKFELSWITTFQYDCAKLNEAIFIHRLKDLT